MIEKNRKGCLILVNKWDLVAKDSYTIIAFEQEVRRKLKFLQHYPLLFISAQQAKRTFDIYHKLEEIF